MENFATEPLILIGHCHVLIALFFLSLLDEAKALMQPIFSKAPQAVRYAKIAINEGIQMDLYRGLELDKDVCALTFGSDDSKEGMSAFLEKRPAVFQNK